MKFKLKALAWVVASLIVATTAYADTYSYTDSQGNLVIVDDKSKIPEKYRKGTKSLKDSQDTGNDEDAGSEKYLAMPPEEVIALAKRGDLGAQACLGVMYARGVGVPVSKTEAVKWYTAAAKRGDAMSQYNLGYAYKSGVGVERNMEQAAYYWRLSSVGGNNMAQVSLGTMYLLGDGITKDYPEAMKYYRMAAQQGDPYAQRNLAIMFRCNRGGQRSDPEGEMWRKKAAENGEPDTGESCP